MVIKIILVLIIIHFFNKNKSLFKKIFYKINIKNNYKINKLNINTINQYLNLFL